MGIRRKGGKPMIHYGDITKIKGASVPVVDTIIFGAPCQDLSVAGKRAGMKHSSLGDEETTRSGLFMEAIRIIKEMRERDKRNGRTGVDVRCRYGIYENVPGALSSSSGDDWKAVLEELARVVDEGVTIPRPPKKWSTTGVIIGDGYSLAWRVMDSQFYGVPQRRRRIALLADFNGYTAAEILFSKVEHHGNAERDNTESSVGYIGGDSESEVQTLSKSLSGHPNEGKQKRKATSTDAERSLGADDCVGLDGYNGGLTGSVQATLGVNCGMSTGRNGVITFEPGIASREGGHIYEGVSGTLRANAGDNQMATAYSVENHPADSRVDIDESGKVQTLTSRMGTGGGNVPMVLALDKGVNSPLVAKGPGAVCYTIDQGGGKSSCDIREDQAPTLTTTHDGAPAVCYGTTRYIVRRLTPNECEALQGYPQNWTNIGDYIDSQGKKKTSSDAARYKALGNSIALPPWKWVLKRLCACYERDATMASLFDGIGGFPFLWEQINGKGSCLWASEIEEFPIAVTKVRIGE